MKGCEASLNWLVFERDHKEQLDEVYKKLGYESEADLFKDILNEGLKKLIEFKEMDEYYCKLAEEEEKKMKGGEIDG